MEDSNEPTGMKIVKDFISYLDLEYLEKNGYPKRNEIVY